eukprot:gene10005-10159_t
MFRRLAATSASQQSMLQHLSGLRFWKPTSPGVPRIGGRNAYGRITVRFRGGGSKRRLRLVDFKRPPQADGVVERLEYDPNRSGYIALDLAAGDVIASGTGVPIKPGNTLALKDIPVGMPINSIELHPGKGGQICRAAGCMATIVNKQEEHAIVRLPSDNEQQLVELQFDHKQQVNVVEALKMELMQVQQETHACEQSTRKFSHEAYHACKSLQKLDEQLMSLQQDQAMLTGQLLGEQREVAALERKLEDTQ